MLIYLRIRTLRVRSSICETLGRRCILRMSVTGDFGLYVRRLFVGVVISRVLDITVCT